MWRKAALCLVLLTACEVAAPADTPSAGPTSAPAPTVALSPWTPAKPATTPGSDLVYLARAWEPSDNVIAVEMPGGRVARRLDASSPYFFTVSPDGRTGYFAVIATLGDRTRASIERVDLRTGASTMRIEGSEGVYGNGLYNDPRHTALLALSADARTIALVRPGVAGDQSATEITLFDESTGARIATAVFPGKAGTTVDPDLTAIAPGHFSLRRSYYTGCGGTCSSGAGQELIWLDERLRDEGPRTADCAGSTARAVPGTGELAMLCGQATSVRFVDASVRELGQVQLPEAIGRWSVGPDGIISLLSRALVLYRIDGATRRLLDSRQIRLDAASLRWLWGPSIALGKTPPPDPAVQFGPDGRTLFVAPWDPSGSMQLPSDAVTVIDLVTASVRSRFALGGTVRGLRLSPDGARLYVLVAEGTDEFPRWLYGLDARDGRKLQRVELGRERVIRIAAVATAP